MKNIVFTLLLVLASIFAANAQSIDLYNLVNNDNSFVNLIPEQNAYYNDSDSSILFVVGLDINNEASGDSIGIEVPNNLKIDDDLGLAMIGSRILFNKIVSEFGNYPIGSYSDEHRACYHYLNNRRGILLIYSEYAKNASIVIFIESEESTEEKQEFMKNANDKLFDAYQKLENSKAMKLAFKMDNN